MLFVTIKLDNINKFQKWCPKVYQKIWAYIGEENKKVISKEKPFRETNAFFINNKYLVIVSYPCGCWQITIQGPITENVEAIVSETNLDKLI